MARIFLLTVSNQYNACYLILQHGIRNFMAQQKQPKQPILIDGKNIFTYCFQPIQRLLPNFTTWDKKFHGTTETTQTTHFN